MRAWIVGIVAVISVLAFAPEAASAPGSLQVIDSRTLAGFPTSLVFTVEAEGPSPIVDIRLQYTVDKMNYATVVSEAWPEFDSAPSVTASWTWDMRYASLPPGADITYWWKVVDADGVEVESEAQTVSFDDTRFDWRSKTTGDVSLYWYEGDDAFANELLAVVVDAIESLANDIGTRVERPISIFIYGTSADMRAAMVYPQEWTGGVAFTDYSIIAIGIGPGDLDWGTRALRHELTHLVVHSATFSPFGRLPTWLDEGLAMHNEGDPDEAFESLLLEAADRDVLLSLRTISGPFSSNPALAYLSYAESHSVVEYMLSRYGGESMHELLMLFRDGETSDDALLASIGIDLDILDAAWRLSVEEQLARV